ncbi:hypothetical protein [Paenibacillus sp. MMO-58]|uniref:hypothetical protein n=1 Tax=Paenibacillus sp. MMO-58 TaxID=3081290 RepID=UPI003016B80B
MNWDLAVFRAKCQANNLPTERLDELIDTLVKIKKRTNHHGQLSIDRWDEQFQGNEFDFLSDEADQLEFEAETNFIAALQAIHPIADIMGQIINLTVLNSHFAVHDASLYKVKTKLTNLNNPQHAAIISAVDTLYTSNEFMFIDAFVNTIKHRNLIESYHYAEYGTDTENRNGLRTEQFEYKQNTYSPIWVDTVINNYFSTVFDNAINIGNAINSYL